MSERIDFMAVFARKVAALPPEWAAFVYEARSPKYFVVKGAICPGVFDKGPRKGQPDWRKRDKETEATVTFSRESFFSFLEDWETETGKCRECQGSGQTWASISAQGTTYRECSRCKGTGLKP